jgi:tetratricopeptide (TPR) repeat protein
VVAPAAPASERPPRDFAGARQLILDGRYEAGIKAMQTLGYDGQPEGAAYIGLAHSRLGRVAEAQTWYERALRANPGHLLTLSFDGMLRAEQGELGRARENLEKIRQLCGGTSCTEYRALEVALAGAAR